MRRAILFALFALLAVGVADDASAQRGGRARPGFARPGHVRREHGSIRARAASPYGYGYAGLPYDSGDDYAYPPQPDFSGQQPPQFVQAPSQPAVEPPAHSVVTEYKWPATGGAFSTSTLSTSSQSEPQAFAIVLKDGSTLSAAAVFASDDGLHYVDSDDRLQQISMSQVDRTATLKLNRARNLNLYLPAAQ